MILSREMLSERLRALAEFQFASVHAGVARLDNFRCALVLIEAARVMDYENVLINLGAAPDALAYPDFDVLTRGWNPLLAMLLPRIPKVTGIPIQESTRESRAWVRSLLHALGKAAVLRKAAHMAYRGLLAGQEVDGVLRLQMAISKDSDHYLDQLESRRLEEILAPHGRENPFARLETTEDEIKDLIKTLVFPFETRYGMLVADTQPTHSNKSPTNFRNGSLGGRGHSMWK